MRIVCIAKDSHILSTKNYRVFVIFMFEILTNRELTMPLILNNWAQVDSAKCLPPRILQKANRKIYKTAPNLHNVINQTDNKTQGLDHKMRNTLPNDFVETK